MSKLLSSEQIISVLKKQGFVFVSQKGSHKKYRDNERVVIVPDPKKEIPQGTFLSILRQAGLSKNNFI
jgi:predicted RNA binding protein YcfA (HicA-like mRNA interferase family)